MEKIHGTSSNLRWKDNDVHFSSGGEKHERFVKLFDCDKLREAFALMGHESVQVYGEAYGGSQQAQSWRYGKELRFVAFEVRIGGLWLAVPQAADVVKNLGLEFVHYTKVSTDLAALDAERDAPSEQAKRNGVEGDQPREGVVLRPLIELTMNDGSRIIAKHKRDDERETKSPRKVVDPALQAVLTKAGEIADEWVVPNRLQHVLDKLHLCKKCKRVGANDDGGCFEGGECDWQDVGMEQARDVINAMVEDVLREGAGEIVDSREARAAIGKKTMQFFKAYLHAKLQEKLHEENK